MAGKQRIDPLSGFRFLVEIEGLIVGGFSEVSGLDIQTDIEEYHEGGMNDHIHKLPKITKQSNITLKRGMTENDTLWRWHQSTVNGNVQRRNGRVILLDEKGSETWYWMFSDGYPIKWTGPDFKADNNTTAVEAIELAHHGLRRG